MQVCMPTDPRRYSLVWCSLPCIHHKAQRGSKYYSAQCLRARPPLWRPPHLVRCRLLLLWLLAVLQARRRRVRLLLGQQRILTELPQRALHGSQRAIPSHRLQVLLCRPLIVG